MAQAPSPATNSTDLPTIIVDPLAYEPERPRLSQTLYDNFIRLARVTLAATAVASATFGIARVLELDSLLSRAQVSALTTDLLGRVNENGESRSSPSAERASVPAPTAQVFLAPGPARFEPGPARLSEVPEALPTPPEERRPIALSAAELIMTAPPVEARESARTQDIAAPPRVNQARPSATAALAKTVNVQDEIRNARRLLAMNRLEQAEAAYGRALALNDSEPAALTGLARVQLALRQLDEALASAMRAVDKAPAGASARLTLGDVLRARGNKSAAQAQYDQASQLKLAAASEP